jgi:spore coat polysaccharide biosynthesis protein SpsF
MRTAVTITVRMKSTRLPKKAILNLIDQTLIEHLIDRVKRAKLPNEVILCTSTDPQDDILIEYAKKKNIKWFRGSKDDVLDRLLKAAIENKIDFIVSTTGDNPLTDPRYIDKIIEKFKETGFDYINCLDLPIGTFSYGVKIKALEKVCQLKKETDTEIWGDYFTKTGLFKTHNLEVEPELKHPEFRLTIDTPEDFRLINFIYKKIYPKNKDFTLHEIINLLRQNPEFVKINSDIIQKKAKSMDLKKFEEIIKKNAKNN